LIDLSGEPTRPRGGRGTTVPAVPDQEWQQFRAVLESLAVDLLDDLDPVSVEMRGAMLTCVLRHTAEADEIFLPVLAASLADQPTPGALALVLAVRATVDPTVRPSLDVVVTRLIKAGVSAPPWADALAEPIVPGEFWRLVSPEGDASVLAGSFERAGSTHVIVVTVDGRACGEASMIGLVRPEDLADVAVAVPGSVREVLDPAQFRWEVESALRIRHEHAAEAGGLDLDDDEAVEHASYEALLRTRLAVLPAPDRPLREHVELDLSEVMSFPRPVAPTRAAAKGTTAPKARPTPRRGARKPTSEAPIYQVKVTLRDSRPPIWRRLEVPADITLHQLHRVLQAAFEWDDMHLHLFETPVGRFGQADPELGLRADKRVTLAEVAPGVKSRIVYEYDFGDSWEHEIVVEKVLDREPTVGYPRCTGGRRAAPPEDCGGVWGYANLIDALADPTHVDHEDLVEWMGLDSGDEFDPEHFDAELINLHLAALR
jgi:hypothetical protein